jgi:hypothetical protein
MLRARSHSFAIWSPLRTVRIPYHAGVVREEMVGPRPFARILAGTDGSERGGEAARQAARLAAAVGAELTLA